LRSAIAASRLHSRTASETGTSAPSNNAITIDPLFDVTIVVSNRVGRTPRPRPFNHSVADAGLAGSKPDRSDLDQNERVAAALRCIRPTARGQPLRVGRYAYSPARVSQVHVVSSEGAVPWVQSNQSALRAPEDFRQRIAEQRQESAEPLWFAVMCRELWGANAPKELEYALKRNGIERSDRTCRAWAAGDSPPPVNILLALLHDREIGRRVEAYAMRDCDWWQERKTKRRDLLARLAELD
jgi:hypothetical protein